MVHVHLSVVILHSFLPSRRELKLTGEQHRRANLSQFTLPTGCSHASENHHLVCTNIPSYNAFVSLNLQNQKPTLYYIAKIIFICGDVTE